MLNGLFNPAKKQMKFRKKHKPKDTILLSRNSILIIEDDPELVSLYQKLRRQNKWPITIARNSRDALAFLNRKPYDVIVLDWNLPDLNGDALIKVSDQLYDHHTKKHDYKIFVKTPIITCTAENVNNASFENSKYFFRQNHWEKPMTYTRIRKNIAHLLFEPLATEPVIS